MSEAKLLPEWKADSGQPAGNPVLLSLTVVSDSPTTAILWCYPPGTDFDFHLERFDTDHRRGINL